MSTAKFDIIDCGQADYRTILTQQEELVIKRRADQIPNTVLLVEHPPVITLGARKSANLLHQSEETLVAQGIDCIPIRRGGGVTAHNPGQLVIYPILNLQTLQLSIPGYVRRLEEIGISLLEQLGVAAGQKKGFPGLWVDERKIASVGVRVSRQITQHGIGINIINDLGIFAHFTPCGLEGVEMTSAQAETGSEYNMDQVKDLARQIITQALGH